MSAISAAPSKTASELLPDREFLDLLEDQEDCGIKEIGRLLESGADIDAADSMGFTALMTAACRLNVDQVAFLLQRGASAHLCNGAGADALYLCASRLADCDSEAYGACFECMRLLLDQGADPGRKTNDGKCAYAAVQAFMALDEGMCSEGIEEEVWARIRAFRE